MKKMFKKIFSSELARGSIILFFFIGLFNFFNYLYHFAMARMLGPEDYGIVATLFAIIYIFSIPSETIQLAITRYTAIFKERGKIKALVKRANKKMLKYGIICFLAFMLLSTFLSKFLKISFFLLALTGIVLIFSLLLPVTRGAMQGTKKFKTLGLNMFYEGSSKFFLAILLVILGLKVFGAISAVILSLAFVLLLSFLVLPELKAKEKSIETKGIYSYSFPILIAIISITLMYSIDVIIVKYFFSPADAGRYAVASLLGKMILFASMPISKAMFPLTAEKHKDKKKSRQLFVKSLSIVLAISIIALVFYFFFPKLIVKVLFGSQYLAITNLIFYTGLAFSMLALSYVIIFYNLSIERKKFVFLPAFFAILQIILLSVFHVGMMQFVSVLIITNTVMLLALLLTLKK